jgi:hypothetical protein
MYFVGRRNNMDFIILFLLVGMLYGIYLYWGDIKYEYSDMGFWGKCFSLLIVLSLIGHLFG